MSLYTTTTNFERRFFKNIYGAVFTTVAWIVVSNLFSTYFTRFPMSTSTYGSLTGIMIVLLWIFICINIVFLGACVNEVIYPQKRIINEKKQKLQNEIESGDIEKADVEIQKRSKFTKLFKFQRPKLNKDNEYKDD
jgi:membrane protein